MMVSERAVFVTERGRESIESVRHRPAPREQVPEAGISNGELSGGTEQDAPGGAYDVPSDMVEEIGERKAREERSPRTPER